MGVWRIPIEITWPGANGTGVNVWHGRTVSDDPGPQLPMGLMITALHEFYTGIVGTFATGTKFDLGQVVEVTQQTVNTPSWTTVEQTAGSGSAPQGLCYVISWRTSIAARRGMGRTFLGPLNPAVMAGDGTPSDTSLQGVRDQAATLLGKSLAGQGWSLGVYGLVSPAPAGNPTGAGEPRVLRDFTSLKMHDKFGHLRSRRD